MSPGAVVVHVSNKVPARVLDCLPVGRLLALEALQEPDEDDTDFGEKVIEHKWRGLFSKARLEHGTKFRRDGEEVPAMRSQSALMRTCDVTQ